MARKEVCQCDVCGAVDSPDNPMGATVTLQGKKSSGDLEGYSFLRMLSSSEPTERLDLCMACSGPLVQMLRAHAERRRMAQRAADRVKPAASIVNDEMARMLMSQFGERKS